MWELAREYGAPKTLRVFEPMVGRELVVFVRGWSV
jgi:hypothetical protein